MGLVSGASSSDPRGPGNSSLAPLTCVHTGGGCVERSSGEKRRQHLPRKRGAEKLERAGLVGSNQERQELQ